MIKLKDKWTLEPDTNCWMLTYHRPRENKRGGKKQTKDIHSYHPTLEAALVHFCDAQLKEVASNGEHFNSQAVIEAIDELKALINSLGLTELVKKELGK